MEAIPSDSASAKAGAAKANESARAAIAILADIFDLGRAIFADHSRKLAGFQPAAEAKLR
jgi:hypothetical protein